MADRTWTPIRQGSPLPPEGALVEVLYADGVEELARRSGSMFILEGFGTYRYVDPSFWRNAEKGGE